MKGVNRMNFFNGNNYSWLIVIIILILLVGGNNDCGCNNCPGYPSGCGCN